MDKKKFIFQASIGCSMLALAFKAYSSWRGGKKPAPRRVSSEGTAYEPINAFIEAQMKRLNIPGLAVAIVEGDRIAYMRGFGRARPGGETPSPQTPFVLGSTTKSFTALAVLQLVEAGKIELDAPVRRYLPWFSVVSPRAFPQVTVRHLLNQTSGLPVSCGWIPLADFDERPDAAERQARALSTLVLTRPPGSAFEYSNMNYNLLGLIIAAASGESYEAYVENHIFIPMGMKHSFTSQAMAKKDGLAVGHRYWFWTPVAAPHLDLPRGSLASGQLISSAEDMAHYLVAHLNEGRYNNAHILSPAGIAELHRPAVDAGMGGWNGQYGMGWFSEEHGQTRVVWHSGTVPDFASYMALLPDQKKGIVLLLNADHFMMNPVLTEVGLGLVSILAGQQPPPSPFGFIRFIPWAMRLLLLVPLIQMAGVAVTLRRVRLWRLDPQRRPSRGRMWREHVLLPLITNLSLAALPVSILASKMRGFILLFLPDFSWTALICGGFACVWAFLRTGLILRTLRPRTKMNKFQELTT